ncbi:type VII secretion integral membrane protein EccD [Streptomyces sp. NPDC046215]|uniref:Type VII secretion integral membrane protein EccD n=1 Tax=Streptomyces stramineus TaxID=173861 RepID=A0ABN1APA2_9ACTN
MSTSAATGFSRVTVVAPDSRIDVALPDDIAVADVYPEILRLTGQTQPPGAPTGYHLVRRDGTVLDSARSLTAQRVVDGELLSLRPFAESLPPAVHDDVTDAVASAVTRDRTLWTDELLRACGLFGGALLLGLMSFTLWFADPRHDMHGLPGFVAAAAGVLLTALAGVRARVYADRASAVALGLAALPHLMIAGSGIVAPDPGESAGRLQFLLGCTVVLIASAALVATVPTGDAPFVATLTAAATGTFAAFFAILADARPADAAAVCAAVAIGAIAFLPGLSARAARLPIGYATPRTPAADPVAPRGGPGPDPIDGERIAAQVRRGHELLLGLVGGCAAVVVGSAAVLAFAAPAAGPWARLLALAAGLVMLLRARLFRYTAQVAAVLGAGLTALALLVLGLALQPPADATHGSLDLRALWIVIAVTLGGALLTAVALIVPSKGLSPFWGRASDLFENALLLALVPLALAVLDLYSAARGLAGS